MKKLWMIIVFFLVACGEDEDGSQVKLNVENDEIDYYTLQDKEANNREISLIKLATKDITFKENLNANDYIISSTNNSLQTNNITIDQLDDLTQIEITFLNNLQNSPSVDDDLLTIKFLETAFVDNKEEPSDSLDLTQAKANFNINYTKITKPQCVIKSTVTNQFGEPIQDAVVKIIDSGQNIYDDILTDTFGKFVQVTACGDAKIAIFHPEDLSKGVFEGLTVFFDATATIETNEKDSFNAFFYHDGNRSLPRGVHANTASISNYKNSAGEYESFGWGNNNKQQTGIIESENSQKKIYEPQIINLALEDNNYFWFRRTHNETATHGILGNKINPKNSIAFFIGQSNYAESGKDKNIAHDFSNFNTHAELVNSSGTYDIFLDNQGLFALKKGIYNIYSAGGRNTDLFGKDIKIGRNAFDYHETYLFSAQNNQRGDIDSQKSLITKITSSDNFSLALAKDNKLWGWAFNDKFQLGVDSSLLSHPSELKEDKSVEINNIPKNLVQIASGNDTSAAVTSSGELYLWGDNTFHKANANQEEGSPVEQPTKYEFQGEFADIKIIDVALYDSVYALTSEGKILSWGKNTKGQLGHANNENSQTPKYVQNSDGSDLINIAFISSGYEFALFQSHDNKFYSVGDNQFGQLGINDEDVDNISQVQEIILP